MALPKVKGLTVDGEKLLLATVIPPSNNHLYANKRRGGGRVLAPAAKAYKEEVMRYLMSNRLKTRKAPPPPYQASVGIHFPPKKAGDANNFDKLVVDAVFEHLGVYDEGMDDDLLYDICHHKFIDAEHPCLILVLRHTDRQLKSTLKEPN